MSNILNGVMNRLVMVTAVAILAQGCVTTEATGSKAPTVAPAAEAAPASSKNNVMRVVYHADFADSRRYSAMLTNIHNMVTTYQNDLVDYDVRIVFVSYGIRFVTDAKFEKTPFAEDAELKKRRKELRERLAALQELQGVKLELCGITREGMNLPEEKIYPGVTVVRSGVVRLAELQHQGFAYLKIE